MTTRRIWSTGAVTALAFAWAFPSACGGSKPPDLTVRLSDFGISGVAKVAKSSSLRVDVDNDSASKHDLLFVRSDNDPGALPTTPTGELDVAKLTVLDRLVGLTPGHFRAVPPSLPPGNYVLVCDLVSTGPGGQRLVHYRQGMHARLEVTAEGG